MKSVPGNKSEAAWPAVKPAARRRWLLATILVLAGIALAGAWLKYGKSIPGLLRPGSGAGLSDDTRARLRQLAAPVEIRFYSVLPTDSAPETLQAFSRRVDQLLSEFQNANDSQIHVTRNVSASGEYADAAAANGLRAFNLEKGGACFLGLAVVSGERKVSLAQLQPEWEPALPFDLARAILQVTAAPASAAAPVRPPAFPEATNDVRRLIPDLAGTSLEEGNRRLREAALQELTAAGAETENQLQAAQQQLATAQNSGSEAEQQAARQRLQQVQLDQAQKYRQIAARLQAQLAAFQQLKTATNVDNQPAGR